MERRDCVGILVASSDDNRWGREKIICRAQLICEASFREMDEGGAVQVSIESVPQGLRFAYVLSSKEEGDQRCKGRLSTALRANEDDPSSLWFDCWVLEQVGHPIEYGRAGILTERVNELQQGSVRSL